MALSIFGKPKYQLQSNIVAELHSKRDVLINKLDEINEILEENIISKKYKKEVGVLKIKYSELLEDVFKKENECNKLFTSEKSNLIKLMQMNNSVSKFGGKINIEIKNLNELLNNLKERVGAQYFDYGLTHADYSNEILNELGPDEYVGFDDLQSKVSISPDAMEPLEKKTINASKSKSTKTDRIKKIKKLAYDKLAQGMKKLFSKRGSYEYKNSNLVTSKPMLHPKKGMYLLEG